MTGQHRKSKEAVIEHELTLRYFKALQRSMAAARESDRHLTIESWAEVGNPYYEEALDFAEAWIKRFFAQRRDGTHIDEPFGPNGVAGVASTLNHWAQHGVFVEDVWSLLEVWDWTMADTPDANQDPWKAVCMKVWNHIRAAQQERGLRW